MKRQKVGGWGGPPRVAPPGSRDFRGLHLFLRGLHLFLRVFFKRKKRERPAAGWIFLGRGLSGTIFALPESPPESSRASFGPPAAGLCPPRPDDSHLMLPPPTVKMGSFQVIVENPYYTQCSGKSQYPSVFSDFFACGTPTLSNLRTYALSRPLRRS